ncbi:putative actin-like protein [Trypanosoma vivax]|nr:putative actin-like protein [Trypanosoma vivax]
MDVTVVIDYGSHTVKHTSVSRHEKNAALEFNVCETPSRAYVDGDVMDVSRFGRHMAELLSDTCHADTSLTISLLLDVSLPRRKRELLLKCCFEMLDAKRVYLGCTASAALYSAGETAGISLDVGSRGVRLVPVVDGIVQTSFCEDISRIGARACDAVLRQYIPKADEPLLLALKSDACFVGDTPSAPPTHLTLPDGHVVPTPVSAAVCGEAGRALLFGDHCVSAPDILQFAHQKWLLEFPSLNQWVLAGGASRVSGVQETLCSAMQHALVPAAFTEMRQLPVFDPLRAATCGGGIVSQLNSFKHLCVSSEDYAEEGPHRCV